MHTYTHEGRGKRTTKTDREENRLATTTGNRVHGPTTQKEVKTRETKRGERKIVVQITYRATLLMILCSSNLYLSSPLPSLLSFLPFLLTSYKTPKLILPPSFLPTLTLHAPATAAAATIFAIHPKSSFPSLPPSLPACLPLAASRGLGAPPWGGLGEVDRVGEVTVVRGKGGVERKGKKGGGKVSGKVRINIRGG